MRAYKWLAGKVGNCERAVSHWYRDVQQPDFETLYRIVDLLGVPVCDLLVEEYRPED